MAATLMKHFEDEQKMPLLFLGHGSPMNAIEENEFVTGFRDIATKIPKPKAVLCVSAHWETNRDICNSTGEDYTTVFVFE
jgi:4,5-DOPA dioxygenase extradiol